VTPLEQALFAVAAAGAALAGVLAVAGVGTARLWRALGAVAGGALLVLVVERGLRAGHLPIMGTWEASVADALVLQALAVGWSLKRPERARVALALGLPAAALLGHGLLFPTAAVPLTISERSWWVDVHALVAYLALALYLASAAASVARLRVADDTKAPAPLLDEAQYRFAAVAFLFHTGLILSGAWYSVDLFGSFWRWDPVVVLAAISWLAWGLALHVRLFFRWRGRMQAVAQLLALVTVLVLYRLVPHLGHLTFHVFDLRFGGGAG